MKLFITDENDESKKSKSINKDFCDDELKYRDYKSAFFNRSYVIHKMNQIQSKDGNIGSCRTTITYIITYSRLPHFLKSTH